MSGARKADWPNAADRAAMVDAFQHRFEELNELLRDRRIPLDAREVIQQKSDACMKAWERVPSEDGS